jgi:hypothetical protein
MNDHLLPIPRIESRAPNKNTIEWEIPNKVSVGFMAVSGLGFFATIKIKLDKKHWWNRSWKTFTSKSHDPAEAIMKSCDILDKYGFYIDPNSIQIGEKIGDPEYFKQMGL